MKKVSGAELARMTALRSVCLPGEGRVSQVYVPGDNFYDPRRYAPWWRQLPDISLST